MRRAGLEPTSFLFKRQALGPVELAARVDSGTGRTRTVIALLDKQVPHLSATVPKLAGRAGFGPARARLKTACLHPGLANAPSV